MLERTANARPIANDKDLFDLVAANPVLASERLQIDKATGLTQDYHTALNAIVNPVALAVFQAEKGDAVKFGANMDKLGQAIRNVRTYTEYLEGTFIPKCAANGISDLSAAHFSSSAHWPNLAPNVARLDEIAQKLRGCFCSDLNGDSINTTSLFELLKEAYQIIFPSSPAQYQKPLERLAPKNLDPLCARKGWTIV